MTSPFPYPRPLAAALLAAAMACGGAETDPAGVSAPTTQEHLRLLLNTPPDSGAVVIRMGGDTVHIAALTRDFYGRQRYRPAFHVAAAPSAQARAVYTTLANAGGDGLDPERYRVSAIGRLLAQLDAGADSGAAVVPEEQLSARIGDLDLLLVDGFARYATDLTRGVVDPAAEGLEWRIARQAAPDDRALRSLARGGDPAQIASHLRPVTPHYGRMMEALARLRQIAAVGGWPAVPAGANAVGEGDSAAVVGALRARLLTSDDPREAGLARRGQASALVFDRDLRDALRHYQQRHALDDDGGLGSLTVRELNHSIEERIEELERNMDRWRWLPRQLGELHILVNIAGFELEVVENGRTIESMNVVVGQPGWQTPIFADSIEHVVVNPYWNVPASIYREEIVPAMQRDPAYLERNNFEWTRDGGVRQRPGPTNALGQYKFLFPNEYNIYLHDTPADHLFSRARRDFSHGCIRLERPADLARLVLARATTHSPAALAAMVATGQEKWVPLRRAIPVYLVYFTAWVKEDGTLRFHHDVYGHDEELEAVVVDDTR